MDWKQVPQGHCFLESAIPGPIKIRMEHKVNTGGQVWNGAIALTSYFERIGLPESLRAAAPLHGPAIQAAKAAALAEGRLWIAPTPSRPAPFKILELGAGTGYAGLWLAHFGADVLLTDLAVQMTTLRSNLYINLASHSADGIDLTARADQFEWGAPRIGAIDYDDDDNTDMNKTSASPSAPMPTPDDQWDHIICSDVLYAVGAHEALVHSLDWLTSARTTVWVSYQHRRKEEISFFNLIHELGFVDECVHSQGNPSSLEEHDPYITIHRISRSSTAANSPAVISARQSLHQRVSASSVAHRERERHRLDEMDARKKSKQPISAPGSSLTTSTISSLSSSSLNNNRCSERNDSSSSHHSEYSCSSNGSDDEQVEELADTSFRPEGNDFLDFL